MERVEVELDLIVIAQAAVLDAKRWGEFVRRAEHRFGGAVIWLSGVPSLDDTPRPIAPSVGGRFYATYAEDPTADPVVDAAQSLHPGEVRRADELVPRERLRTMPFASEWLMPQKLSSTHSLIARLDGEKPLGFLRLFWPCGARGGLPSSRRILSVLTPLLLEAIRASFRLRELDALRSGLQTIVDGNPMGVILMEDGGRVLATNAAADRLLVRENGVTMHGDRLCAATCEGIRELRALIGSARAEEAGRAASLLPREGGRAPLHAIALPIPSGGKPTVALLLGDPESEPELRCDLLQRLHHLTPAEAALAQVLAQGHDLTEAAAALGLTRHTVRSRLRDIFNKTGTSRQAALVERLLASPAFLDAGR